MALITGQAIIYHENEWQSNILVRLYQIIFKIIILSQIGADKYQNIIFEILPWRTVQGKQSFITKMYACNRCRFNLAYNCVSEIHFVGIHIKRDMYFFCCTKRNGVVVVSCYKKQLGNIFFKVGFELIKI